MTLEEVKSQIWLIAKGNLYKIIVCACRIGFVDFVGSDDEVKFNQLYKIILKLNSNGIQDKIN